MSDEFDGNNGVAAEELRQFIERVERLNEEIASLNSDKSEVFAEAKSRGFDVRTIKQVIAIRKQDHAERQEREAILELYLQALGIA